MYCVSIIFPFHSPFTSSSGRPYKYAWIVSFASRASSVFTSAWLCEQQTTFQGRIRCRWPKWGKEPRAITRASTNTHAAQCDAIRTNKWMWPRLAVMFARCCAVHKYAAGLASKGSKTLHETRIFIETFFYLFSCSLDIESSQQRTLCRFSCVPHSASHYCIYYVRVYGNHFRLARSDSHNTHAALRAQTIP